MSALKEVQIVPDRGKNIDILCLTHTALLLGILTTVEGREKARINSHSKMFREIIEPYGMEEH